MNKKTITMKPFVSTCCKGGFKVISEDEGTSYHECLLCKKPCDIESFKKPNNIQKRAKESNKDLIKKELKGDMHHIGLRGDIGKKENKKSNMDWVKRFTKKFNKHGFSNSECTNFKLAGLYFKEIRPFITKELAKKDKAFIKELKGLEMEEEPETFTKKSGGICIDRDESLKNLIRAELNQKLKQIIKKYEM